MHQDEDQEHVDEKSSPGTHGAGIGDPEAPKEPTPEDEGFTGAAYISGDPAHEQGGQGGGYGGQGGNYGASGGEQATGVRGSTAPEDLEPESGEDAGDEP